MNDVEFIRLLTRAAQKGGRNYVFPHELDEAIRKYYRIIEEKKVRKKSLSLAQNGFISWNGIKGELNEKV